jgi:hypothetical protein
MAWREGPCRQCILGLGLLVCCSFEVENELIFNELWGAIGEWLLREIAPLPIARPN